MVTPYTPSAVTEQGDMPYLMEEVRSDDTEYKQFYDVAQLVTGLIIYPIICVVGICGSILTLVVFNQHKMITSTSVLLSALAVADLIKLLNDTLYFIVSILIRTSPIAANTMMGCMYPFSHYIFNQSVCVASWLTVCIGVERYLFVCHLSKARQWCTVPYARIVSTIVFIAMSVLTIPSALRYTRITVHDNSTNTSLYDITLTQIGHNESFMMVYNWTINLLRSVIPLCLLLVINSCIIQSLRNQRVKGKICRSNKVTFMLVIVIVVFVVCVTPDAIMSTVFGFGYIEANYLGKGLREFTDVLLSFNSAVNFTIYCLCSKTFRDTFNEVFCRASRQQLHVVELRKNSHCPLLVDSPNHDTNKPLPQQTNRLQLSVINTANTSECGEVSDYV